MSTVDDKASFQDPPPSIAEMAQNLVGAMVVKDDPVPLGYVTSFTSEEDPVLLLVAVLGPENVAMVKATINAVRPQLSIDDAKKALREAL